MDVSRHQGTIDWAKVKASGQIGGVMIRAMGNSADGKASKPYICLLYTSPSLRDVEESRMPSSA